MAALEHVCFSYLLFLELDNRACQTLPATPKLSERAAFGGKADRQTDVRAR